MRKSHKCVSKCSTVQLFTFPDRFPTQTSPNHPPPKKAIRKGANMAPVAPTKQKQLTLTVLHVSSRVVLTDPFSFPFASAFNVTKLLSSQKKKCVIIISLISLQFLGNGRLEQAINQRLLPADNRGCSIDVSILRMIFQLVAQCCEIIMISGCLAGTFRSNRPRQRLQSRWNYRCSG